MSRFTVCGTLHFSIGVEDLFYKEVQLAEDIEVSIKGKEICIKIISDTVEGARDKAEIIALKFCRWLSLLCNTFVSANLTSVKNKDGRIHVKNKFQTCRHILLPKETLDRGIDSFGVSSNSRVILELQHGVEDALECISLGNYLLDQPILFRYRYAILEYSRAVEGVLGQWGKGCEKELKRRGWVHLIQDVNWLLSVRGGQNVAHYNMNQASENDAHRACEIAKSVIFEETGYIV